MEYVLTLWVLVAALVLVDAIALGVNWAARRLRRRAVLRRLDRLVRQDAITRDGCGCWSCRA
jgi:hypothetical protein